VKLAARDRRRLERALCVLVDYEGPIKDQINLTSGRSYADWALEDVCEALRELADGRCLPDVPSKRRARP